jgi:hypothetical protein
MKKFLGEKILILSTLLTLSSIVHAVDFLSLTKDITGEGIAEEIKLVENESDFYLLTITSNNREIIRNGDLIPRTIKNSGGLDIFQGISVTDGNLSIRYKFCSPSSSLCSERNIIISYKESEFIFSREDTIVSADMISIKNTHYPKEKIKLSTMSYQTILENNDDTATAVFSKTYGKCVKELGGDTLTRISDELDKDNPGDWLLKKDCITPALVFTLQNQGYISVAAPSKYLKLLLNDTNN